MDTVFFYSCRQVPTLDSNALSRSGCNLCTKDIISICCFLFKTFLDLHFSVQLQDFSVHVKGLQSKKA